MKIHYVRIFADYHSWPSMRLASFLLPSNTAVESSLYSMFSYTHIVGVKGNNKHVPIIVIWTGSRGVAKRTRR